MSMLMLIPGLFTCSADNGVGQPDTASISLTVECKYSTFLLVLLAPSWSSEGFLLANTSFNLNLISSMSAMCWVRQQHALSFPFVSYYFRIGYPIIVLFSDSPMIKVDEENIPSGPGNRVSINCQVGGELQKRAAEIQSGWWWINMI